MKSCSSQRDKTAARRFLNTEMGRQVGPDHITLDGSDANTAAIKS
jgi:transposase-like protein